MLLSYQDFPLPLSGPIYQSGISTSGQGDASSLKSWEITKLYVVRLKGKTHITIIITIIIIVIMCKQASELTVLTVTSLWMASLSFKLFPSDLTLIR